MMGKKYKILISVGIILFSFLLISYIYGGAILRGYWNPYPSQCGWSFGFIPIQIEKAWNDWGIIATPIICAGV